MKKKLTDLKTISYPPHVVNPMTNSPLILTLYLKISHNLTEQEKQAAAAQLDDIMSNNLEILRGTQLPSRDSIIQSKGILAKGAELNNP